VAAGLTLDQPQRAFFAEHGWLVVRGVVAAARVAELAQVLDKLFMPAFYPSQGSHVWEVPGLSKGFEAVLRHARDPAMAALAAQALGARRLRLLQDTCLVKPPLTGGRVEWHQDYTYVGYLDPPRAITARLALAPCTPERGGMMVLDGSHRWGLLGGVQALSAPRVTDALRLLGDDEAARAAAGATAIGLEPGDVSLHHCLTFHGSGENRSAEARKTLITRYFDGECRLVPERLPSKEALAHFPADAEGRLSEEAFPVVYEAPH